MNPERESTGGEYRSLTGAGPAAIAIIHVRGPGCGDFLRRHVATQANLASADIGTVMRAGLLDERGDALDDILLSVHAAPPACWDVRLHLHGNPWLVRRCAAASRATVGPVLSPGT